MSKPDKPPSGFCPSRLQAHRHRLGLTQGQVAEKARISVSQLRNYERGRSSPSFEKVCTFAEVLDVPVPELMQQFEDPNEDYRTARFHYPVRPGHV